MSSINRLLTAGVIGSLLLAGVIIAQTANWLLDSALLDYMASDLRAESRSLLKAIRRGPDGVVALDSTATDPAYDTPLSGRYFVVTIGDRQWRSRSLWDEQLAPTGPHAPGGDLVAGPNQQRLLWDRTGYRRLGESVTVLVGVDYSPILDDIRQIRHLLLASGILALILLALLQQYLVRRSLRPLGLARQQIEQLTTGTITALDETVPRELAPLVREINHLLRDTQQQLHRSRTALADLSHALKTPLAVLRNLTDRDAVRCDPALRDAMNAQIEQIRQRITREMAHARTAGSRRPDSFFNIDTDLPLLLDSVRSAQRQAIPIDTQLQLTGQLPWEREDLLELLGNLLDNACKWGRDTIRLAIQRRDDNLLIQVDDDGPGIPEAKLQQVLERGERLDQSVLGHGLGLAIVADKVAVYGGNITFSRSEYGGLGVTVELPWRSP
ncbi:MAG: GHKL domain-containing protein [Halioglobus sp.]|nr:GHKL domain-containing protein [Halioglobus sp.]